MELTDHQIRLLKIVDSVRWGEADRLGEYEYVLIRRALGERDTVITFELEQAVAAMQARRAAGQLEPSEAPPEGSPERSPWLDTWMRNPLTGEAAPTLSQLLPGNV
ncbi:hypothetical protein [Vulcanococcus sp.]|uniref:hypothetical protein n=1 Tax=Vulcanococcus sp. TaxID=2856995 RepID=UPI003C0A4BB3